MSSIPRKSVTGLPLKKYVLDTLNGLIDYLQTHRIQAGRGIDVRETASGYVIGLAQPPSNPPQVQNVGGGGGGADGIEASVTGGTASITLTGGTGSVNLVGTGGVTISGNTSTGNIEIDGSALPFPVSPSYNIALNSSHVMGGNGWVAMTAEIGSGGNSGDPGYAYLRVINNGTVTDHLVCCNGFMIVEGISAGSLMIPVVAGATVTAYLDMDSNYSLTVNVQNNKILIYE